MKNITTLEKISKIVNSIALFIIYSLFVTCTITLLLALLSEMKYAFMGGWVAFYSIIAIAFLSLCSWSVHLRIEFLLSKINHIHLKKKKQ